MSWALKENLQKIVEKEDGAYVYPQGQRTGFALVYPNSYFVGMSNLGMHILYQQINERTDTACERLFLPEKKLETEYLRTNTPLMSIETQRPLYEFPLIGFAVSFEMDMFHLLRILELGKVEPLAELRIDGDPIVIAGGPCATFNPEPLSPFVDAFVIGEGEEVIQRFLDCYYEGVRLGMSRVEQLRRFAALDGIYVPCFYEHCYKEDGTLSRIEPIDGAPERVCRQWVRDLDAYEAHTVIMTEDTEFKDLYLLEIARGCGRHCRFCMAGYCFRKPRVRSLEALCRVVDEARGIAKKIGLMGAAVSDHPDINSLCRHILSLNMKMSVASFRADSVDDDLVKALAESGLRTLTLAPEAGSQRMRDRINKGISDADLYRAVDLGAKAGIRNFRLYIMIGLPFEEDEDVEAIVTMAENVKCYMTAQGAGGTLTLSVNPFIPKPFTPFQWLPLAEQKDVERKLKFLRISLKGKKGIELLAESSRESYVQALLARGDRRMGHVLYDAHCMGGAKHFRKAMKNAGLDEMQYLYRKRGESELFPWDCLNMGMEKSYLWNELERAVEGKTTPICFEGCQRCGVCK